MKKFHAVVQDTLAIAAEYSEIPEDGNLTPWQKKVVSNQVLALLNDTNNTAYIAAMYYKEEI